MKKTRSRKIERSQYDFDKGLNEVNELSVAEMLNEMAETLDLLRDCEFLNASQQLHVAEGSDAIHAAIDEWKDDFARRFSRTSEASNSNSDAQPIASPPRALDALAAMLDVYHDDMHEEDYPVKQRQRIMIAVHNLLAAYREIEVGVH